LGHRLLTDERVAAERIQKGICIGTTGPQERAWVGLTTSLQSRRVRDELVNHLLEGGALERVEQNKHKAAVALKSKRIPPAAGASSAFVYLSTRTLAQSSPI
jgi:hypothetical protein